MARINTPATGHGNKVEHYSGGLTIQYKVFLSSNATETARLLKIKNAYTVLDRFDKKIKLTNPCN